MSTKPRLQWIDVAKGLCIISVIAGHLKVNAINNIVFSYHLTVFFILSGYTLKADLSQEALSRKFRSLMIPYFITCSALTAMDVVNQVLVHDTANLVTITKVITQDLIRSFMASGSITEFGTIEIGSRIGAIWFLPATFFAVLFAQILLKYVPRLAHRYCISIAIALLSYFSAQFIWLPFSIQSACLAVPLIMAGYDWRVFGTLDAISPSRVLICAFVFAAGILLKVTPVYYVTASMPDFFLSTTCALASSICIIWLSKRFERCRPLAWIGRNSLYFLCIHLFEMETMGHWFRAILNTFNLPYNPGPRFVIKLVFITTVTAVLLLIKKLHFRTVPVAEKTGPARDSALDVAKAALIILMILGHLKINATLRAIIYSFHMMAFVFYSGYCFRAQTAQNIPKTILKDVKRFLLPYALFGIGYLLVKHDGNWFEIQQLLYGFSFTGALFSDIASIGPVYFILLLFVTKIIYLFIERLIPNEPMKGLCVLALSLLGVYLGKAQYWLPWSIDCALYSLMVYHLGHCFKKYHVMDYLCARNYTYFILSPVWAFMIYMGSMEIAVRNYGTYGTVILGTVSASVLLYMLCRYISQTWSQQLVALICKIGQNTLYILIVHVLFRPQIASIASIPFTEGSIFHAGAMIILQLLAGTILGILVNHILRQLSALPAKSAV